MTILITGGAGYIGNTIAYCLQDKAHQVILLDDFSKGPHVYAEGFTTYRGHCGDIKLLEEIFKKHSIDAVIHCAAFIVVPESMAHPDRYYQNNVVESLQLFQFLANKHCPVVFSSSASVYQTPISDQLQVKENSPIDPKSPYAKTKYIVEMILQDFHQAYQLSSIALRYFNPIGADPQLRTGPYDQNPSHVLGQMILAAEGQIPFFKITGNQFKTKDGTGIRDYIHVQDLALAHLLAIEYLIEQQQKNQNCFEIINLGTQNGWSVLELFQTFEKQWGQAVPHQIAPARPGDSAGCYACSEKAKQLLHWQTTYSLAQAIDSVLAWRTKSSFILGY